MFLTPDILYHILQEEKCPQTFSIQLRICYETPAFGKIYFAYRHGEQCTLLKYPMFHCF